MNSGLIKKYNIAAPRYTSYPTVPYWEQEELDIKRWIEKIKQTFSATNNEQGISIYIHLPFCESLCTYCGCNTRITVNHGVEVPYIQALIKEWKIYLDIFPSKPLIREIHLGGGTPTFFSPQHLQELLTGILTDVNICDDHEFGFEGHPNNTSAEHLKVLYDLGFRRVSFGIQDFDPVVQEVINRHQTFGAVEQTTKTARAIGYTSVSYDLIYGLPLQTLAGMKCTIEKVKQLNPDRIAFYSYAHVPWLKPGQRKFTELDLPEGEAKRTLYETGRSMLEGADYVEIGMDHFALKSDYLYAALQNNSVHRNFMGYTTSSTKLLIGLGVSSISDSWNAFAQNVKVVEEYLDLIDKGLLPVFKGHFLSDEDLILRRHILNIMCRFETYWHNADEQPASLYEGIERMDEMAKDGLVVIEPFRLRVTEKGRAFIRNICMALDARLWRNHPKTNIFSSTA